MMFDQFAVHTPMDKESFEARALELRQQLLHYQFALEDTRHSLLLLIAGLDGAGKGVLAHRLNEWMDPRGIETHTYWDLSDEDESHPYFWRYWRRLPPRGRTAIFLGSWYRRPIQRLVDGEIDHEALMQASERIRIFERQLSDDGVIIVKIFLHVSEEGLRRQLEEKAPRHEQNPRVTDHPYELRGRYTPTLNAAQQMISNTQTLHCPWHIVDGEERYSREISAGEVILQSLRQRLEYPQPSDTAPLLTPVVDRLAGVPLDKTIQRGDYKRRLSKYQSRLQDLVWETYRGGRSLIAVFEGWDAAGKGSALRRVTAAIDPRLYKLVQIGAPTDEETARHYLWRFWRQLQRDGRVTLFDRSWYGRVLVERVEQLTPVEEWQRAYAEINEMEAELVDHGCILAKFWLHISPEEQLQRFRQREKLAYKRYKITEEDWRNREKWPAYEEAVNQMINLTHTPHAPWHLVPGNDKHYARVRILKRLCKTMAAALDERRDRTDK